MLKKISAAVLTTVIAATAAFAPASAAETEMTSSEGSSALSSTPFVFLNGFSSSCSDLRDDLALIAKGERTTQERALRLLKIGDLIRKAKLDERTLSNVQKHSDEYTKLIQETFADGALQQAMWCGLITDVKGAQ